MSRLFISHSSANDDAAIALKDWLVRQGWSGPDDIFLDIDPERGIAAGERWVRALEDAATRCETVLFLISEQWLASKWCGDEYQLANRLNKKLFALLLDDIPLDRLPGGLTAEWQVVPLKGEPSERFLTTHPLTRQQSPVHIAQSGLAKLKRGLDKAGIRAETFELQRDPDGPFGWRAPYRGLEAMEPEDAAVFFGRNADIVRGIDMLRGLAARNPPRLLVVLGASGAGKSSFLRAGLWPRLARDDSQWLPLRAVRAGRGGAIEGSEGLLAALEEVHRRFALRITRANLRDRLKAPDSFIALLSELRQAAARRALIAEPPYPLPVICLDQGEEVFASGAPPESERLLQLARAAIGADAALLLVSIRSDSYGAMQGADALAGVAQVPLSLGPVPHGEIAHVIREPAEILRRKAGPAAPLFDPAVIERLQREMAGEDDALPLLAFVLQRLMREHEGIPVIGVEELDRTGGVAAAIEVAAEAALDDAGIGRDRASQREALRRLFIPRLARVARDSKAAQRRVARQNELPAELLPLARALTERRLLVMKLATQAEGAAAAATLEVAHEALLRRWPTLAALLDEDRDALLLLDGVLSAAADWEKAGPDRKPDFLAHRGSRLADAQALAERGPDWEREMAAARGYLAACQARELAERRQRERLQRRALYATAAGLLVAIVLGGLATYQWYQADCSRLAAEAARTEAENERARATREAKDAEDQRNRALLNESRRLEQLTGKALAEHDSLKTVLLALEGLPGPRPQEQRPHLPTLESILYQAGSELRELPPLGASADIDAKRFVADDGNGNVAIYDNETGARLVALAGHTAKVTAFAVSKTLLASGSADKTVRLWDVATGRPVAVLRHDADVVETSFQGEKLLMTGCADGSARLWNIPEGTEKLVIRGHVGPVRYLYANDDVHRAISAGDDKTARLWDTTTGRELATITVPAPPPGKTETDSSSRIFGLFGRSGRFAVINRTISSDLSDAVVLDTATGRKIHHFAAGSAGFRGGQELIYATQYGGVRHFTLWDPKTDRTLVDRDADWEWGDGRVLLWSQQSATAELWNDATGERVAVLSAPAPLTKAEFLAKAHRILTASTDGSIAFWSGETGELVRQVPDAGVARYVYSLLGGTRAMIFDEHDRLSLWDAAEGARLLSATKQGYYSEFLWKAARYSAKVDGAFVVWDLETGKAFPQPDLGADKASNFEIGPPRFSDDGNWAASVVSPNKIRIWKVETGKKITDVEVPTGNASITLSPDGSKLLVKSGERVIQVRDTDWGKLLGFVTDATETPNFSPHGGLLMQRETKDYRTVLRTRLWRMDATSPMTSVWTDSGKVDPVQFISGGERNRIVGFGKPATESVPRRLQVYDLEDGARLQEITGPAQDFQNGVIGDDGRRVVARLDDGTARIWDIKTGEVLATIAASHGLIRHGDRVLAKTKDYRLQMWDIAAAKMVYELQGVTENVTFWNFSRDGRYLATASRAGNARIWDAGTGRQLALFADGVGIFFGNEGDRAFVRSKEKITLVETATGRSVATFPEWQRFAYSRSGPAALVIDKNEGARIIDTTTGETRTRLPATGEGIRTIQVVDNAKIVLIEYSDGPARLFDGQSGREMSMPPPRPEAGEHWLSPDGRFVAMEYGNAAFRYEIATGSVVPLQEHKSKIVRTRLSDTGRLLLTASEDGDVWLSDLASGKAGRLLDGSGEPLLDVLIAGDERRVVTQSLKGTVRMWDAASGALIKSVSYDASARPSLDLTASNGMLLVMVNRKFEPGANVVEVIDETGAVSGELHLSDRVVTIRLNDDDTRMLAGTMDKNVELWDMARSRPIAQMWGDPDDAVKGDVYSKLWRSQEGWGHISLSFSGDRHRIAAVTDVYDHWSFRLWDWNGQKAIATQRFDLSDIDAIDSGFTPDSRRLWTLIGRRKNAAELHIFDAETGKQVAVSEVRKESSEKTIVAPGADHVLIVPDYESGNARLWDMVGGKQVATIPKLSKSSSIPQFSPDGKWIATASPDHAINIWDASTGTLHSTFSGHTGSVKAIAFSRDGRFLASGSADGSVRVWDFASGKPIHTLVHSPPAEAKPRTDAIEGVAFADDGGTLAAGTDHFIGVWKLSASEETAAIPLEESSRLWLSRDGLLLLRRGNYSSRRLVDRIFPRVEDAVVAARQAVVRCLTLEERKAAFIDLEPPDWCIEMKKPPYRGEEWKSWLEQKRAGHAPALPLLP